MKNTRAIFTVATFFALVTSFNSNAQLLLGVKRYSHDTRLDFGVSLGMPTTYEFKTVIDADVRLQRDFSPSIAGLLNVGFTYFLKDDAPVLSEFSHNLAVFPVKTGAKVFLTEKLYVTGEIGAAFRTTAILPPSFLYSPGVGLELKKGLDLGLRYESYSRFDVAKVAIKAAYGFRLRHKTKYTSWYH